LKVLGKRFVCVGLLVWLVLAFVASLNLQLPFNIPSVGAMSNTWQVSSSSDDCYRRLVPSQWGLTEAYQYAGSKDGSNYKYGGGMRFTNIVIPQGAVIVNAYLSFYAYSSSGTVVRTKISAEDVDNPSTFADDAAAFDSRYATHTSAMVEWDSISAWSSGVWYNSVNISSVVQEVVNRGGWVSGNSIVIFWEDFDGRSDVGARRIAYSADGYYYNKLYIEWKEAYLVDTSTSAYAVRMPIQRRAVYASGLYWMFYANGVSPYTVYRTCDTEALDVWSNSTQVTYASDPAGADFCVWLEGTNTIHYVFAYAPYASYYCKGTLNINGTITWATTEQVVDSQVGHSDPVICVDSAGYPWIAYLNTSLTTTDYPYITKSSLNNGTWQTASGFPYLIKNSPDWNAIVVPLTNQMVYVVYGKLIGTADKLYGKLWNGTAWGSEETVSTSSMSTAYMGRFSAIAIGNDVHVVFQKDGTNAAIYVKRTWGVGWSGETTIESSYVEATTSPVLSYDDYNNTYYFWAYNNRIYYKRCVFGVWDSGRTEWINEASEGLTRADKIGCFYKAYGGKIGLYYSTKSSSPYRIKFHSLIAVDIDAPTYSNIAHSTTLAGGSCLFSCKWQDNIALNGYVFSWNGTGTWQNNTWTALTTNPAWANVTKTLPSSPYTVVGYKWYCNDASDNWNETTINTLTTTPPSAYPTYDTVSVNSTVANEPCDFSSKWYDDVGLSGYILSTNTTTSTDNTAISDSNSDGYIYFDAGEYTVARVNTYGLVSNTSASSKIGQQYDGSDYYIYRTFLFFDTSTIPTWAHITSATLSLYIQYDYSTTDFNVTIQTGGTTYPHDPMVNTDYYYTHYSGTGGSRSTNTIAGAGYWNVTLTASGLTWITKEGLTKLCLRSSRDISANTPSGNELIYFYSNEQGASYAPKLYITYQNWVNETWTSLSGTVATASKTLTLPSTIGQLVGYRWYCNDTDDQWTTTIIYVLTTTNSNPPTYSNIGYNTTLVSMPCEFSVELADDYGLSGYTFSTNNTGSWTNDSWVDLSGVLSAWANVTKTLNDTVGIEVSFKWIINDTNNNIVTTTIGVLILTTTGSDYPYYSSVSYNTTLINMPCKFTIKWMDDVGLSGYIFSYNPTGSGWVNGSWTSLTGTIEWVYNNETLPSLVGTTVQFRWYCNDSDNQWTTTSIFSLVTTQYVYYFSWNYKDLDAYVVDSYVTWQLYQGVNLISYTKGQATLTSGTYTLKAYYLTNLINETTLSTGTYGNQTLSLTLQMKQHTTISHGYVAFDKKISSITINKATSDELRFTVVGDYSDYIIIIGVAQNATLITRNGVAQTGWTYDGTNKYVKITVANLLLASWSLVFPSGVPPSGTIIWYFRSDTQTVNEVTGYKLEETNTGSTAWTYSSASGDLTVYFGYRVWLVDSDGRATELTSGQIYCYRITTGEGSQNTGFSISSIPLQMGFDAVKVSVYIKIGSGEWESAKATFISDRILKTYIEASTWVFQVYTKRIVSDGVTYGYIYWGSNTYQSGISGIQFTEPGVFDWMLYNFQSGNLVTFITLPYTFYIGGLFYGLMVLVICVPLYNRYKSFTPILFLFILLGGGTGFLSLLVPEIGLQLGWLFLMLGLAGLIYKVTR
jgi:hypothetical protein